MNTTLTLTAPVFGLLFFTSILHLFHEHDTHSSCFFPFLHQSLHLFHEHDTHSSCFFPFLHQSLHLFHEHNTHSSCFFPFLHQSLHLFHEHNTHSSCFFPFLHQSLHLFHEHNTHSSSQKLHACEGLVVDEASWFLLVPAEKYLRHHQEAQRQEECGDVDQEEPLEEDKVGEDVRAKVPFNLLQVGVPQLQGVFQFCQVVFEMLPALARNRMGHSRIQPAVCTCIISICQWGKWVVSKMCELNGMSEGMCQPTMGMDASMHTQTHIHVRTHTHAHILSLSHTHTQRHACTHACTHSHTHTHTHTHTHACMHTLSLSLSHTYTHTLPHSLSHTNTHMHACTHALTLSHTHTHITQKALVHTMPTLYLNRFKTEGAFLFLELSLRLQTKSTQR